jgi:antitoxin component of MazEF toxin-antitoxin module
MIRETKPMILRRHGGSLAVTIPAEYVREIGLAAGDTAIAKHEPDGLRLRFIRHSTLVELANAQESQMAEEGPVAAAE